MKTILAAEHGILPNQNKPYASLIADLIEQAGDNTVIVFEAGTYLFDFADTVRRSYAVSNTFSVDKQAVSLVLENRNNVTLDFGGAELLFNGWQSAFALDGCRDITVKNATIDWQTPTSAEGTVLNADFSEITLHIDNAQFPHCVKNDTLYFTENAWGENAYWASMEYDKDFLRVRGESADRVLKAKAVAVDENTVKLIGAFTVPPMVGNYLALRHGERTHAGVFCQESTDIRFENVTVHNSCGIAFVCQFCENVAMESVAVVPNEAKGRLITSAHDDAMQFSNCKGAVNVINCRFRGMFDDSVNVHGTSTRITERSSDRLCGEFVEKCSAGFAAYAKAGDEISFINRNTMDAYATATVQSFRLLNNDQFELIFTEALPQDVKVEDAMENLTNTPTVRIENCCVGSARARGVLVATPKSTVIAHNVFDTSGSAILISGDANGWFESGACKDVIIDDNQFTEHCLSGEYQFGDGIISLSPVIPDPQNSRGFHQNIRITNNRFTVSDRRVLYAFGTKGIRFADNTIAVFDRSGRDSTYTCYEYCSDIVEENNRILDTYPKNLNKKPLKIAFLGDSVTEGCFELIKKPDGSIEIVRDVDEGYVSRLTKLLIARLPNHCIETVNAGISGNTSAQALARMQTEVLDTNPDIVIVCLGLNDVCLRQPEEYTKNMDTIFSMLRQAGLPVIFMTPNMINTYVHENALRELDKTSQECCACQNDGTMDHLIACGIETAKKHGCAVCDCYRMWKQMAKNGVDTTELLCNYINHPTRQLHQLFANALFPYVQELL